MKKIKNRILSIVFICAMLVSFCVGLSLMEVHAEVVATQDAITISKQPESITIDMGERATFTVEAKAADDSQLTYQWQVDAGRGEGFRDAYGSTDSKSATFTTYSTDSNFNGYKYRCIITDGNGNSVTSDVATLTLNVPAPPTVITGVSIVKTTDGYKVIGLKPAGEGYKWGYYPYKIEEGLNLDEIIEYKLNEHIAYGPWENETPNIFDDTYEITTYTSWSGEEESVAECDYIEIVKLDDGNMICEVAILPLPKTVVPTYPLGTIVDLGNDSITIDENNWIHFDVPDDGDDYIYVTSAVPTRYLGEMSAAEYIALYKKGVGKPVVDVKGTLSIGNVTFNTQLQSDEMTIFITNGSGKETPEDSPVTEESIVVIYKLHKDNLINATYDTMEGEENPYFQGMGVGNTNIYAVYGVHAEVVTPTGTEDILVDKIDVQLDWNKIPALEVGMDRNTLPKIQDNPVSITAEGVLNYNYGWAIKVDESFKIEGDDDYNEGIQYYIDCFDGWIMLEAVLYGDSNYRINTEDTYALFVYIAKSEGYTFGEPGKGEYTGTVNSNIPMMAAIPDSDGMVTFFKLGTLEEIEEEKGGNTKVEYDITLDRTNYADGWVLVLTYDSDGANVEETEANNGKIVMPENGKVRVFADSEFTVDVKGATISEMKNAGEEGYYYEITGITADTTVVVNLRQEPPVVTAPTITGQPQNVSVQEGEKATYSVTATGEGVTYQWQIDRNDGNGFVNLSGATSTSYTTSTVSMNCNGFKYQCIVSNAGGSVTSNTATLTVTEKPVVHTHSLTIVPAKTATCTSDGNKEYYICSGCDNLYVDENGNTITTAEAVKIPALGHDWSGKWTITKESTSTEEGKKETLCTHGCGQKKVVAIPKVGETDENGNLDKDAEVTPEAPIDEVTLNNSKEEILKDDSIFDESEKALIESGEDARIWLEISKTNEADIKPEDKVKMEVEANKIIGKDSVITYFDADLFKQVGNGLKKEVREPGIAIKITITIPDKLLNTDKKVSREYKIVRLHDGKVDVIDGTFDSATGEFTFESDKFSTYAIIYKDVDVDDKKEESPKTGDSNNAQQFLMLMLVSGLAITCCSRKKEIMNNEN